MKDKSYNRDKVDSRKALDASFGDTKVVGHHSKSKIQSTDQGMMHMLMMQNISPIYDDAMLRSTTLTAETIIFATLTTAYGATRNSI
ncbi:hypothetical protein Tco_0011187 [Tanacetum coccineum]